MNNERITQLLGFLQQEPNDPFILYGLALEYQTGSDQVTKDECRKYFDKLLSEHKDYVPTYYHAAHFYWDCEDLERAKEIFETGIATAKNQQDQHATAELSNAYQNFLLEEDLD